MVATENIDLIGYCLNRTEIALVFRFEKQIDGGALKRVGLLSLAV
jgi:hypothetical protein